MLLLISHQLHLFFIFTFLVRLYVQILFIYSLTRGFCCCCWKRSLKRAPLVFQAEKKARQMSAMNAMKDHKESETESREEEVSIIKHPPPSKLQQQQPPQPHSQSQPQHQQQSLPQQQQQQQHQQPPQQQQQQQPTDPASPTVATTPEPVAIGGAEKTSPNPADTEPEYDVRFKSLNPK